MTRPRVLISAYACEPGYGSEAGIGWNTVTSIAPHADVWVITRRANQRAIESHSLEPHPLHFEYYDLPRWLRFWKKGSRGARLYYLAWQLAILPRAFRLHRAHGFDIVHHVTFGALWLPTFLFLLPVPFLWGPVGGGEMAPPAFRSGMSLRGRAYEWLRGTLRRLTVLNPLARWTARRSVLAWATTPESARLIGALGARTVQVLSHVALPRHERESLRVEGERSAPDRFRVLSVGRLVDWKGVHLGLRAFARLLQSVPDAEYLVIGDGPARAALESQARELGFSTSVHFTGPLPREAVLGELRRASVLLHPSLHDSGGYACAEAMAAGTPVLCLDFGAPPLVLGDDGGIVVTASDPESAVARLASGLVRLATEPDRWASLSISARNRTDRSLAWEQKGRTMATAYRHLSNHPPPAVRPRLQRA